MPYSIDPLIGLRIIENLSEEDLWGEHATGNMRLLQEAEHSAYTRTIAPGDATYTLTSEFSGGQAHRAALILTGAITADFTVVVPAVQHRYLVLNRTTNGSTGGAGPWTVTVKTSSGTGVATKHGDRAIVYCDGTNVDSIFVRSDHLNAASNLSDLQSASAARGNLGLAPGDTARSTLGFGGSALLNTGTTEGTIPVLGAGGTLPAIDGNSLIATGRRVIAAKSADYTAVGADLGKTFVCSAALSLTLTAAATLGSGWWATIVNSAAAADTMVTIDPTGSELINGLSTYPIAGGESCVIVTDGSAWRVLQHVRSAQSQKTMTGSSVEWSFPADYVSSIKSIAMAIRGAYLSGTNYLLLQLGTGSDVSPSWITSGYTGYACLQSSAGTEGGGTDIDANSDGIILGRSSGSNRLWINDLRITKGPSNTWLVGGSCVRFGSGSYTIAGEVSASSVTRVRLIPDGLNTLSGGTALLLPT